MAFLSRRPILLAILLYGQFKHLTQFTLRPNIQLSSTQQHAYQSFSVTSWRYIVCNIVTRLLNFEKKTICMNMNYNYLNTIYEGTFAQMYKFLVEKYIFPIFAYKFIMVNIKNCNIMPEIHTFGSKYLHICHLDNSFSSSC